MTINIDEIEKHYFIYFGGNVEKLGTGKMMSESTCKNGYKRLWLTVDGIRKTYLVHRLVASKYLKNPKNKPQVNHRDGDKSNNVGHNLEWVTASENHKHAYRTGLNKGKKGKKYPKCGNE